MLLLPLLSPAHVASQGALLDVSSEGRLRLGVAPGWQRDEFDISGTDHTSRFGRFREALEIVQRLWTANSVNFHRHHFNLVDASLALHPLHQPRRLPACDR